MTAPKEVRLFEDDAAFKYACDLLGQTPWTSCSCAAFRTGHFVTSTAVAALAAYDCISYAKLTGDFRLLTACIGGSLVGAGWYMRNLPTVSSSGLHRAITVETARAAAAIPLNARRRVWRMFGAGLVGGLKNNPVTEILYPAFSVARGAYAIFSGCSAIAITAGKTVLSCAKDMKKGLVTGEDVSLAPITSDSFLADARKIRDSMLSWYDRIFPIRTDRDRATAIESIVETARKANPQLAPRG